MRMSSTDPETMPRLLGVCRGWLYRLAKMARY